MPISAEDTLVVPDGYTWEVLIPWGTPLLPGAAPFAEDASNTAAEQAEQVGFNHDGMHFFPRPSLGGRRGVLVVNHEYPDPAMLYTASQGAAITDDAEGVAKVDKALAAVGVSVVSIERNASGSWRLAEGDPLNRRITGSTPVRFSGPVASGDSRLSSVLVPEPLGTFANCAMGVTPWGTYLTCEENWDDYFGTTDAGWTASAEAARYGLSAAGAGYDWHVSSPRFDLARNPNEPLRFGWVVEIDPFDPSSAPVKRTALGRFKHECATCTEWRGHLVVYSGDDENGEYLYKYVSRGPWRRLRARGESPLDHGTLHVARFHEDGSGEWLPLVHGVGALTSAQGWVDQGDVVLRARQAADAVGATRLHRPEWVAVQPQTGAVFVTLTNGSGNSAPVNSGRDPNPYGHIVRIDEDPESPLLFSWDVFLVAGDPTLDARVPATQPAFGSPDGLAFDPDGRLWIQTDVSNSAQHLAARGYSGIGNNAMLVANPETGEIKRFLTGPRGCEITGITMTPDQRTLFINVQHPGESTRFWVDQFGEPTPANPTTVSRWPFGGRPRPATVVIRKADGGKVGT